MSVLNNLRIRLNVKNDSPLFPSFTDNGLKNMQARLNVRGGTDQWTRMR